MRISDWSSDVCSSDLGSSLLAMKLAERIRGLPGNGGAVATTVIFGRPTPALLAAELRGQSDRTIDATRIARVTDRRAGMAYEPIAIVAMAGRFPGAPDVRSDEHTSELQSLMRISYAVS